MMRRALACVATLMLLTACGSTGSLTELRHAPPANDPYHAALASGYQSLAEEKLALYSWASSKYFADKGLMAAYGRDVAPEEVENWQVAPASIGILTRERERLMAAIDANKTTQPALAAQAVTAYDRWLEAVASEPSPEVIDERETQYQSAVAKLREVQAAQPGMDVPVSEPVGKTGEKTTTVLYFPFDSASLGTTAKAALTQLVADLKRAGNVSITINGHADRAGSEPYNLDLSERRAKFVAKALNTAGVPAPLVSYFAFGESDPAVPTADGVKEPKNRRVEIFIE